MININKKPKSINKGKEMITRINSNKFKTNEIGIFLTLPLNKKTITMNALIPQVLRRGTNTYKTQYEIGKKLEDMYGAYFNYGIEKVGDNLVLKFYISSLCDKYANQNLSQETINLIFDIIFNPLIEECSFKNEYVEQEKENLKKIIESRKDDKSLYSYNRCIEEMFKDEPYGIYKFGSLEELNKINSKNLYDYYKEMTSSCKISIVINGEEADKIAISKINIANFEARVNENETMEINKTKLAYRDEPKIINEELEVTQGKLNIGLYCNIKNKYIATMYNMVLGGGANSKLFKNVREKASLAYTVSSRYLKQKDAIIIRAGIELENYDKTVEIIKKQLEDMKCGNISDEEFKSAKQLILSSIKLIPESQEEILWFNFIQKITGENLTVDEYYKKIEEVSKDDVIKEAKNVGINTIYFLKNKNV